MKNLAVNFSIVFLGVALILVSCKKSRNNDTVGPKEKHLLVVNTGSYTLKPEESLNSYNIVTGDFKYDIFKDANGTTFGQIAHDSKIYGGKLYMAIYLEHKIKIVNPQTGALIKTIDFTKDGAPFTPRRLLFQNGKGYISSWEGYISILDTTSLTVTNHVQVGRTPEVMAIANNKLYVVAQGLDDDVDPENKVAVVNLNTFTKIKDIQVGEGPYDIDADPSGDLYVSYGTVSFNSGISIIDSNTDQIKQELDMSGDVPTRFGDFQFAVDNNKGYYFSGSGKDSFKIKVLDTNTETVINNSFITDGTKFQFPNFLQIDPETHDVYVGDKVTSYGDVRGKLYVFDSSGKLKYSFTTGYLPIAVHSVAF